MGIIMSILQIRSLLPNEVNKSPAQVSGKAELGSWAGASESRAWSSVPTRVLTGGGVFAWGSLGLASPGCRAVGKNMWSSSTPAASTSVSRSVKWRSSF